MKNKLVMGALSLAVAFGLWLYVVTVVSPEAEDTYYNVPVVIRNESYLEDRGLMITENKNATVTLRLKGNRTDLRKLSGGNLAVVADVSNILTVGEHALNFQVSLPGDVPDNAVEVQNRNPDKVTISVENRVSKPVPVVVEYDSNLLGEGYIADKEPVLSHSVINISGPASVVTKITQAKIVLDLKDRVESIKEAFVYTLCDENGTPVNAELVTTNAESVDVDLRIQRTKEVSLDVTVLNGGGATREDLKITIEPEKIWVSGSDKLIEQLGDVVSIGQIDLSRPLAGQILEFPLGLGEGITVESPNTVAKVTVEFLQMSETTLTVSNVGVINILDGLRAELITQSLAVTVRGPKALINVLKPEDIVVTLDAANAQIDTPASVEASITVNGQPPVVVLGSYQVKMVLRAHGK